MYQTIDEILTLANAGMAASEAHGAAVGMLIVEVRADASNWMRAVAADEQIGADEEQQLLELFEQTRDAINGNAEEFGFDLLLPDDEDVLHEQAEALRSWCEGFLWGIGYSHAAGDWPGELGEVMRDMIELTKMDTDVSSEEDADMLVEIREYVRAAVFIARDYFIESGGGAQSH
ncbi:MAG: UPF0149 family protein [Methylomonas sp.]